MRIRTRSVGQKGFWKKLFHRDQSASWVLAHGVVTGLILGFAYVGAANWWEQYQYFRSGTILVYKDSGTYYYFPAPGVRVEVYKIGRWFNAHVDVLLPAPLASTSPLVSYRSGMRPATGLEIQVWRRELTPIAAELRAFPSN
jgi:hypothetical protein